MIQEQNHCWKQCLKQIISNNAVKFGAGGKRNDFKTYDVSAGEELASGVKRELKRIRTTIESAQL